MNSPSTPRAIFAESGPFTAMHNALFDWVQPRLSLSAWSVLCVVVRRTRGWNKKYDAISYEQIMAATGIKSAATVAKALNELLSDLTFGKPILRRQKSQDRTASRREATRYALNPRFEVPVSGGVEGEFGTLDCEGQDFVRALENEGSEAVGASNSEETKETPNSSEVENSRCEHAHAPSASASTSPSPSYSRSSPQPPSQSEPYKPSLLAAVCAATLRDPPMVSAKMRCQLVACARTLERAGYGAQHIELAAARWTYPTAPTPSQLLDNIQSLLSARPHQSPSPHRAKSSNPAAPSGAVSPGRGSTTFQPQQSRFECAAERKSRKWADWLGDLGGA